MFSEHMNSQNGFLHHLKQTSAVVRSMVEFFYALLKESFLVL